MDCISKNYKCLTDSSTRFLLLFLSLLLSRVESQRSPPEDENQYARFNPSMAIIMVVLVGALFVLGFFSIYVRRCSEDGGNGSQHAGGLFPGTQRSGRGLDADVLETFPMFTYSSVKGFKMGKGALECAICLNEFADEETIRLIPNCDHVFHAECIDAWLQNNVTCPVCRSNLTQLARDLEEINISQPVEEGNPQRDEVVLNRIKSTVRPKSAGFRSHSTGHSVVGEDTERFTLRLPEEVRNKMISNALVMNRSGEGSGRKGYMEGSSSWGRISYRRMMSDGWVFSRPPSFLSRALSQREKATTSADNIPLNNLAPKSDAHPPV